MSKVSVQVEGLREVVRDLEKAGVELTDLKDVFGRIAQEGAEVGASFTPFKTGALRATARGNKAKNKAVVLWGRARVQYAGPLIYGWPRRGIKAAGTTQKTDAVMDDKAPQMLEDGLGQIFKKYGFN